MFPIPWNFPFRKKNGDVTTLDAAIGSGGGGGYELPTASAQTKGGIKVGAGLSMDGETLNNTNPTPATPYELPTASVNTLGGIKVGSGLSIADGVLSVNGGGGGGSIPISDYVNAPNSLHLLATGEFTATKPVLVTATGIGQFGGDITITVDYNNYYINVPKDNTLTFIVPAGAKVTPALGDIIGVGIDFV